MGINWPLCFVIATVCLLVGTMAWLKYIPGELVTALVSGLIGWLIPSPLPRKATEAPPNG